MEDREYSYADVREDVKSKSIWNSGVDFEKVMKLPPQERGRLFPNDFSPSGEPYGDF